MEMKKINDEYVKLKADMEKFRNDIKKLKNDARLKKIEQKRKEADLEEAQLNGDKSAEKSARSELKKVTDEIEQIKKDANDKMENVKAIQKKINDRIKEIKENPEMKKHLESVMAKKYDRKLNNLKKEKEEVEEKKEKLKAVNELVNKHPSLGNNLKGIITATKDIEKLTEELKKLDPKDKARRDEINNKLLPDARAKLANNKSSFMSYVSKHNMKITDKDIEELANGNIVLDKSGNVNLNDTLNKNISSLTRQSKGYDKSIRNYQKALESIENYKNYIKPEKQKNDEGKTTGDGEKTTESVTAETATDEKPKWYQFIKRFKNWNEKRKQQALPEPTKTENEIKNEFKNSLKYDIVKDMVKQMETDDLKEAKKTKDEER